MTFRLKRDGKDADSARYKMKNWVLTNNPIRELPILLVE
jgi:hypothetical protein